MDYNESLNLKITPHPLTLTDYIIKLSPYTFYREFYHYQQIVLGIFFPFQDSLIIYKQKLFQEFINEITPIYGTILKKLEIEDISKNIEFLELFLECIYDKIPRFVRNYYHDDSFFFIRSCNSGYKRKNILSRIIFSFSDNNVPEQANFFQVVLDEVKNNIGQQTLYDGEKFYHKIHHLIVDSNLFNDVNKFFSNYNIISNHQDILEDNYSLPLKISTPSDESWFSILSGLVSIKSTLYLVYVDIFQDNKFLDIELIREKVKKYGKENIIICYGNCDKIQFNFPSKNEILSDEEYLSSYKKSASTVYQDLKNRIEECNKEISKDLNLCNIPFVISGVVDDLEIRPIPYIPLLEERNKDCIQFNKDIKSNKYILSKNWINDLVETIIFNSSKDFTSQFLLENVIYKFNLLESLGIYNSY